MTPTSPKTRSFWIGISIATALATPFVFLALVYWNYTTSYQGVCGPHAPDIDAHPCSRETYLREFAGGFAFVGLVLMMGASFSLVSLFITALWVGFWMLKKRAIARQAERPPVDPS
jgi:hypothetical protein